METLKQSGLGSSLGTHAFLVVIWWLCISSSFEARKFDIEGEGQLPPKTTRIYFVIPASMGDEL